MVACLRQLAQEPQRQAQALERLHTQLESQTARLAKQIQQAESEAMRLRKQREMVKQDLSAGRGDAPGLQASLKSLTTALEDQERALSDLRVTAAQTHEQQLSQQELQEALIVASPAWETLFPQLKRRVLERLLDRVEYDGATKRLTLTLSARGLQILRAELQGVAAGEAPPKGKAATMRFEFPVELKPVNLKTPKQAASSRKALPGIVRSLVLGHQLQWCLKDEARSYKQVGQWLGITHARISQVLSLTLLAPDIQEQILLGGVERRILECDARAIASTADWTRQRARWQELVDRAKPGETVTTSDGQATGPR